MPRNQGQEGERKKQMVATQPSPNFYDMKALNQITSEDEFEAFKRQAELDYFFNSDEGREPTDEEMDAYLEQLMEKHYI